jgi:hypothetical protein
LKFQTADPPEFVETDCVELLPLGAKRVNTTFAPETGKPPLVTVAVSGTVPGREKTEPGTERIADKEGAATTVAFALSVIFAFASDAVRLTA